MKLLKKTIVKFNSAVANRAIFKKFAAKYQLVFFGDVDKRYDDYEPIGGFIASTDHVDTNYTVGTINGVDITLLQRHNAFKYPGKPKSSVDVVIMKFHVRANLPYILIERGKMPDAAYHNLSIKMPNITDISGLLEQTSPQLTGTFRVFTPNTQLQSTLHTLAPEICNTISQFSYLDVELSGSDVFIYGTSEGMRTEVLDNMLRLGLWLVQAIEHIYQPKNPQG